MKNLKINYSSLNCPHCGASKYTLSYNDVFTCEYCNQSFNFNLEEIDVNSENKIFVEELKSEFYNKIEELEVEKANYKNLLLYYQKLSQPKALTNLFLTLLIISSLLLYAFIMDPETFGSHIIYGVISVVANLILFILFKKCAKSKHKHYLPYVSFFAEKVVDYQYQIDSYKKYISLLSK